MNLLQTLATVFLVAGSATGMVIADQFGIGIPDLTGRSSNSVPECPAVGGDDGNDDEPDGNSTSNSTSSSGSSTSGSNSTSGSASNSTSSSNSTTGGNSTSGSSSGTSTSASGNSTAGNSTSTTTTSGAPADDCDEPEPEPEGNETAEPEAEPEPEPEAPLPPPDPMVCNFHIDEWGGDYLALRSEADWEWRVTEHVERVSVYFHAYSGMGLGGLLGGGPEVRLVDGDGRILATSDSSGHLELHVARASGYLSEGLWRLSFESDEPLTDYHVAIDVDCAGQAPPAQAAQDDDSTDEEDDEHKGHGHDDDEDEGGDEDDG